jgi:hypothetical protein
VHAGRPLFKLASYVCNVLAKLVKHQTWTGAAWVAQPSILFFVLPLLRIGRVRKGQILLDLPALIPQSLKGFLV